MINRKINMENMISGIFQKECKGRFLCEVKIENKIECCYIGSSAKLGQFIDLEDREVYLSKHKSQTSKTKYALYAIREENDNVTLLNLNKVNFILKDYLILKGALEEKIRMEVSFKNGLKADVVYYNQITSIYEAKTILARDKIAIFPSTKTKRVRSQLIKFIEMLKQGYDIQYCFFILSFKIEEVVISHQEDEIRTLFFQAVELGMKIHVFRCAWNGQNFYSQYDKTNTHMLLENINQSIKS